MDLSIPTVFVIISLISIILVSVSLDRQRLKIIDEKQKLLDSYREDYKEALDVQLKLRQENLELSKNCNNQNILMGVWDKLIMQLYKICPNARIWKVNTLEVTEEFIQVEVEYYRTGITPRPKEWSAGKESRWEFEEIVYVKDYITFEIPLKTTSLTRKYGKALNEMEVSFK